MPATIDTKELFPPGTTESRMKKEVDLRMKACAIRSHYTGDKTNGWVLVTTWNVIGQQ